MRVFRSRSGDYYDSLIARLPAVKRLGDVVDLLLSYRPEGKLLEIGCGMGVLLGRLARHYEVFATETSPLALHSARLAVGQDRVWQLDISAEVPPGLYDIVVAINVLEHIKEPLHALRNIRKVLKVDGILAFCVPNNCPGVGWCATRMMGVWDPSHCSALARREWLELLPRAGLVLQGERYPTWLGCLGGTAARLAASTAMFVVRPIRPAR